MSDFRFTMSEVEFFIDKIPGKNEQIFSLVHS